MDMDKRLDSIVKIITRILDLIECQCSINNTHGEMFDVLLRRIRLLESQLSKLEELEEIVDSIDNELSSEDALEIKLDNLVQCLREDIAELRKRLDDHTSYMLKSERK